MTGRLIFRKYELLIFFLEKIFSILPKSVNNFLWNLSMPFSGSMALLLRYLVLRKLALGCGKNVYIGKNVILKNFNNLKIGNNVSIHTGCYLDSTGGITINNDVSIAHQSTIMSFNHTWDIAEVPIKYNPVVYKEVVIEEDVWIGCAVRIMPGVTIHKRSVVAAGAIVTSDVESNTLVGGVPAKMIKRLCN